MDCPYCSQPGAKRVLFKVRCPNAACPAYDASLSKGLIPGSGAAAPARGGPASPGHDPAPASGPARELPWGGISWVLWIAAYGLFRFGQHREGSKAVFWGLAVAVAIGALLSGFRAKAASGTADADDDDDGGEPRPRSAYRRDEREGPFDPSGERRIDVRYRTAAGEDKTFTGDRASLRRRKAHVSLRVAPEGIRIALRTDRIANRAEVEGAIPS